MNGATSFDESTMRKKGPIVIPSNVPRSASPSSQKSRRRRPLFRSSSKLNLPVLGAATCILLLVWYISAVFNGESSSPPRTISSNSQKAQLVIKTKELKDVKLCVVFQVYNHKERYEAEVQASMARLKKLNPDVTTILITDNKDLADDASIDILKVIPPDDYSLLRLVGINDFTTRLLYLSTLPTWAPDCDMHMSLDSHVTVCSSNLRKRLLELYTDPTFQIGTNVEHNPYPSWKSTPFTYDLKYGGKYMPHNFCMVFRTHSAPVIQLLQTWYEYMTSWNTKLMTGLDADDQKPLQKLLSSSSTTISLTRLTESFAMAEKSVHKRQFGFYPRFTYALQGNVTMIHSHRQEGIPEPYHGDMCAFMNSGDKTRMLIRHEGNATHPGLYQLVYNAKHCEEELLHFEPRICRDPAQLYGLTSTASWLSS
jgi:hypothetical protein